MRNHPIAVGTALLWLWYTAAAAQYTIQTIDYPGFQGTTVATGINHAGRIVGAFSVPGTQDSYGFTGLLGTYSLLPSAACQTVRCEMTPLAINARGDIAGEFSDNIDHRAVFIINGGTLQLISIPSSTDLAIFGGLNDRGDVVGYFQTDSGLIRMFLYSRAIFSEPAVPADFVDVAAMGISNGGQVAGTYDDAKGLHGFVEEKGRFSRIDVPGALGTSVVAINERGDVVGNYAVLNIAGSTVWHGFVLSDGEMVAIDVPGGTNTLPTAIGQDGTVAGTYENPAEVAPFNAGAFVLSRGRYTQLPLPGAVQSVSGISERGEVVGTYYDPDCPVSCGVHGFVAMPGELDGTGPEGSIPHPEK